MSEQQRRLERERRYAILAEKARLNHTFVTSLNSNPPEVVQSDGLLEAPACDTYQEDMSRYNLTLHPTPTALPQRVSWVEPQGTNGGDVPGMGFPHPHVPLAPQAHSSSRQESMPAARLYDVNVAEERACPTPSRENFANVALRKNPNTEPHIAERLALDSANRQTSPSVDVDALQQRIYALERQLREEQTVRGGLERRIAKERPEPYERSNLIETLDLKESELLSLQGKLKELRFHNRALTSQIEELRRDGPQTEIEVARTVQLLKSEVERLATQNEVLQRQLAMQKIRSHELWTLQEGTGDYGREDPYALLDTAFK